MITHKMNPDYSGRVEASHAVLPFRGTHRRVFGPRRSIIPYRGLGGITIAIGIAIIVAIIVGKISGQTGNPGPGFFLVALGIFWYQRGSRLKEAPIALSHVEGSVLYLRAFDVENRPFVTGPYSRLGEYSSELGSQEPRLTRMWRLDLTIKLSLEEFLSEAISKRIGPFVGLGNPGDKIPPAGAIREYAQDAAWKRRFTELAHSVKCIVLSVGDSGNLQWELAQIRQMGTNRKLCIFTSPRSLRKGVAEIMRAEDSSREDLLSDWRSAGQVLDRAGFECEPACPGFGAALSFDDAGKSVLLTTDANTPEDYVMPVASWIAYGTRTGKCILTTCNSCGMCTYVAPNGSATASRVLCFICAQKAKLAAMGIFGRVIDRYPILGTLFRYGCLSFVVFLLAIFLIPYSWDHSWKGLTAFAVLFIGVYYCLFAGVRWLQTGSFKTPTSKAQSS